MDISSKLPNTEGHKGLYQYFNHDWWMDLPFSLRAVFLTNILLSGTIESEDDNTLTEYIELFTKHFKLYEQKGFIRSREYSYTGLFNKIKNSESFVLVQSQASSNELKFVGEMKNLKRLALINCTNIENLDFIEGLDNLEFINISIYNENLSLEHKIINTSVLAKKYSLVSLFICGRKLDDYDFVPKLPNLLNFSFDEDDRGDIKFLNRDNNL